MKRTIIIDTNGMMIPGQFGIDIFTELNRLGFDSYVIPRASVRELEKISRHGRGRDITAAKIALSLVERCTIIEKDGFADDVIMEIASGTDTPVLTNDTGLKKRLCSKGVTIVQLRERTHLSL